MSYIERAAHALNKTDEVSGSLFAFWSVQAVVYALLAIAVAIGDLKGGDA